MKVQHSTRRIDGQDRRPTRFRMQTHTLGAPIAEPQSLIVAGLIAIALYLIGRRLSH